MGLNNLRRTINPSARTHLIMANGGDDVAETSVLFMGAILMLGLYLLDTLAECIGRAAPNEQRSARAVVPTEMRSDRPGWSTWADPPGSGRATHPFVLDHWPDE